MINAVEHLPISEGGNDEIKRLKKKSNALLVYSEKLTNENKRLQQSMITLTAYIEKLENENKSLQQALNEVQDNASTPLSISIKNCLLTLKAANSWITVGNNTANTKDFYRMDKDVFEKLVPKMSLQVSSKELLKAMADYGIIKKYSDGRYYYPVINNNTRYKAYLFKISAISRIETDCKQRKDDE